MTTVSDRRAPSERSTTPSTPWSAGRFDARRGRRRLLFGRMYEDAAVEARAFRPGGRVVCIASAGCTARALARTHDVVAVDVNPVQLAYARTRSEGGGFEPGAAERLLDLGRSLAVLAGWWPSRLRAFLDLDDPEQQIAFWHRHLDTRRFRLGFDGLLSRPLLRRIYAEEFLGELPRDLGPVLRSRMERCFALHPNRSNPYARALFLGETVEGSRRETASLRFVHADAAEYLESETRGSLHGFALSNVLDGVDARYEHRLVDAVRRAAAPDAMVVLRSFREPRAPSPTNRAAEDRSMLWGVVDVGSADAFEGLG